MVRTIVAPDGGDPDSEVAVDTGSGELTPEFLAASGLDAPIGGYWSWDALSDSPAAEKTLVWPMRDGEGSSYCPQPRAGRGSQDPCTRATVRACVG